MARTAQATAPGGRPKHLRIRASAPGVTTALTVPAARLHAFLDRTLERVAAGAESTEPHLDAALASWLGMERRDDAA